MKLPIAIAIALPLSLSATTAWSENYDEINRDTSISGIILQFLGFKPAKNDTNVDDFAPLDPVVKSNSYRETRRKVVDRLRKDTSINVVELEIIIEMDRKRLEHLDRNGQTVKAMFENGEYMQDHAVISARNGVAIAASNSRTTKEAIFQVLNEFEN